MIKSILYPTRKDYELYYKHRHGRKAALWQSKLPIWVVAALLALFTVFPLTAQLQQSGGPGSNASVGSTGATAPTSATLSAGVYNSTLPSATSGYMYPEQLDSNARQIIVGAGTAGSPTGGVVSVQGVSSGTAIPASQSGTWTVQPGNTANTTAWLVTGTGGTFPASESGTWTVGLNAGTNLIGYTRAQNGCSTTVYESGMAYLPTTSTAVTSTSTCVALLALNNSGSTAQTVTVTDGSTNCNSAACPVLSSFVLPANSNMLLPLYGMKFASGIKWSTTTANQVMGDVIGNQ
jgi:hypothetical protein